MKGLFARVAKNACRQVAACAPAEIRRRLLAGEQKSVTMVAAFFHYEAWATSRRRGRAGLGFAALAAGLLVFAARRR